jgi:hypothetical protein
MCVYIYIYIYDKDKEFVEGATLPVFSRDAPGRERLCQDFAMKPGHDPQERIDTKKDGLAEHQT